MDYVAIPEVTERLMERVGVKTQEELFEGLQIDLRTVEPRYAGVAKVQQIAPGVERDAWGRIHKNLYDENGNTFKHCEGPFHEDTTLEDLERHNWPDYRDVDLSTMEPCMEKYRDYATYTGPWTPYFCMLFDLFGLEDTMMLMCTEPEIIHKAVEKMESFFYPLAQRMVEIAKKGTDILFTGDDYAGQNGLNISLEMFREFYKEPMRRIFQVAKDNGMLVMMHSCGAVSELIPEFIEMGADLIDPLQTTAAGMDPYKLKEEFGDKVCFHGGIDQQSILPFGTVKEVREHVREMIRIFGKGGGYILCPSHDLLPVIPLDNILAMYDEAAKFRF